MLRRIKLILIPSIALDKDRWNELYFRGELLTVVLVVASPQRALLMASKK